MTNGLGTQGQRYSPLTTINKDNVQSLVPAWTISLGGEKMKGQETQPLVKDGVMYFTGSYSRARAVDTKTGHEIWQYDHRLPEGILPCCDVIRVAAAAQPVLVVRPCAEHGTPFDLVRAAYHLGNRHVQLELQPDHLKLEPDPVLAEMLRRMHLTVHDEQAAFEPEGGAYAAGGHAHAGHAHDHGHDHGHGHDHAHATPSPARGRPIGIAVQAAASPGHVHGPGCGHDHHDH